MFLWSNSKSNHCSNNKRKSNSALKVFIEKYYCDHEAKSLEIITEPNLRWLIHCFMTISEYFLQRAKISETTCILHSFHKFDASRCSECHNVVDDPIV